MGKSISLISFLAANFKLMELMCSTILDWKLKIDLIPWQEYFLRSPNVPSTSMELLEQLRKKMDFAFCPKILSMRKSFFSYGFLVFVAVVTGMFLIYRIVTLAGGKLRVALITVHGGKSVLRGDVSAILDASPAWFDKIGDWFLLNLICKNLNVLVVNDFIKGLHKDLDSNNSNTETLKLYDNKLQTQTSQV